MSLLRNAVIQKNRQPGQTSTSEVAKRDLRAELIAAEQEARDHKRKAAGLPSASVETENGVSGDERAKRRKLIQDAVDLDKDDDDSGSDGADESDEKDKVDKDDRLVKLMSALHSQTSVQR